MPNYSSYDYELKFSPDFQTLEVREKNGDQVEASYDLTQNEVKVEVDTTDDFVITVTSCTSGCYSESYDISNGEVDLNWASNGSGETLIGVTEIRVERSEGTQYTYYLGECPVWLKYVSSSSFTVKSPCNGSCTGPLGDCRSSDTISL